MADGPIDAESLEYARALIRKGLEARGLPYPIVPARPETEPDWARPPAREPYPLSQTYVFDDPILPTE